MNNLLPPDEPQQIAHNRHWACTCGNEFAYCPFECADNHVVVMQFNCPCGRIYSAQASGVFLVKDVINGYERF